MTGCVYVGVLLKHCTVSRSGKGDNGHPPPVSKGLLAASYGKNWRELPDLQILGHHCPLPGSSGSF